MASRRAQTANERRAWRALTFGCTPTEEQPAFAFTDVSVVASRERVEPRRVEDQQRLGQAEGCRCLLRDLRPEQLTNEP
jgi:hypothetical protein